MMKQLLNDAPFFFQFLPLLFREPLFAHMQQQHHRFVFIMRYNTICSYSLCAFQGTGTLYMIKSKQSSPNKQKHTNRVYLTSETVFSPPPPRENTSDPIPPQINNSRHPPVNTMRHYSQQLSLEFHQPHPHHPQARHCSLRPRLNIETGPVTGIAVPQGGRERGAVALLIFLAAAALLLDNRNRFRRRQGGKF